MRVLALLTGVLLIPLAAGISQTAPLTYAFPAARGVAFVVWHKQPVRPRLRLIPEPYRHAAPEMELAVWKPDGKREPFRLSALKGQIVFLDFWAPSCPPCVPLHAFLVREAEAWRDHGVVIISVLSGDDPAELESFLKSHGGEPPFPVLLDPSGEMLNRFVTSGLPGLALIDHHGRIAWQKHAGSTEVIELPTLFPTLLAAATRR